MLIIPLLCHLESGQPSNGKSIGHFVDVQACTYLADLQLCCLSLLVRAGSISQVVASRLWCTALVEMGLSYSRVDLISAYQAHDMRYYASTEMSSSGSSQRESRLKPGAFDSLKAHVNMHASPGWTPTWTVWGGMRECFRLTGHWL